MAGDGVAVLALDLASRLGWAARAESGAITYGIYDVPGDTAKGALGAFMHAYTVWLSRMIFEHRPAVVIFESPFVGKNPKTTRKLYGMTAITEMCCYGHKVPQCLEETAGRWRQHYLGFQRAPGRTYKERRANLKAAAIKMARLHGFEPQGDNDAEALGLLDYTLAMLRVGGSVGPLFSGGNRNANNVGRAAGG